MKTNLTEDELQDRIEMLQDAREKLDQAIGLITDALWGTDESSHAQSYIIPHLKSWLYEGGHYNVTINHYIESLKQLEGIEYDEIERNEHGDELVGGCATCGEDVNTTDNNGNCKNCK